MFQVIETGECALHKIRNVKVRCDPPIRVCPMCQGGAELISHYGCDPFSSSEEAANFHSNVVIDTNEDGSQRVKP